MLLTIKNPIEGVLKYGAPGAIRTPDRLVRSQVLYPAELQALKSRELSLHHPLLSRN